MIRPLGEFEVTQRTKDGMFNATELLKQWNSSNGMKKEVNDFIRLKSTKQFQDTIIERENINGGFPVLKTRGKNASTWMHPLIFIDFAMWINPNFKYDVLRFVHDQLIEQRHKAGSRFVMLTSSASRFKDVDYPQMAKALNWVVFGRHEKGIRNYASQEQLDEISDIEKSLSFSIDMGYIKSFEDLIEQMRVMWRKKYLKQ